ncbi:MAG TPA: cobyric acid synthase [Desulfomonilaceae bacterium]|nr:cobyric acid synthase [Desulfomonilaceae bacterium]
MSRHGGNLRQLETDYGIPAGKILDFSANINPLGFPDWLRPLVSSLLESVVHYPDPECTKLVAAAEKRYACKPGELVVGNGSSEIISCIPRAAGKSRAVILEPTYSDYFVACTVAGLQVERLLSNEESDFRPDFSALEARLRGDEIVFLCNPNNPTGLITDTSIIRAMAREHPATVFVVDEAFGDFVVDMDSLARNRPENVVVLLSLTKIFAIPGLRLGCALCPGDLADAIRRLQPTWSVNVMAQSVGEIALQDEDYVRRSRTFVQTQRETLQQELKSVTGLTVYPGCANFLLVRIDRKDVDATILAERMLTAGIAIRICDNFTGLDRRFFRVAVRTPEENRTLCDSLRMALGIGLSPRKKQRTPAVMFQGTSSNAGKSVLTAALGRILLRDGYRVAPFKAQNMSLNSFVTRTGGEMGRAQVVQAQACRLDPDVRMNPVLLKPNSDTGSQVIVMGKPVGNMAASEFVTYKSRAFGAVKEAYDSLSSEYDVMVLEGAGSPGEVNLKHHDIVNMHMARYAQAPVLLVGDIDRGGVFASFVGIMEVLEEWERGLVAGFVVNRFRGDKNLLGTALDYTLRHTNRPVLGVVPYFHNLGLPEEDSVSFKEGCFDNSCPSEEAVDIAILDLPHISNFTDFDAFRIEPDVRVTIVRESRDLNTPDAVIIPGSKNTIGDLEYLKNRGIEAKLRELSATGTELVGLCGGFQMMGRDIADPHRLETDGKTLHGLGLLDITTVLAREKTLTREVGVHLGSGLPVRGYEIHHGRSESPQMAPLLRKENGETDGITSGDGRTWGTYLHGIFDSDEFRRWFIDRLRKRRGLPPKERICAVYDLEPSLDRLAEAVAGSVDMGKIYKIMGL